MEIKDLLKNRRLELNMSLKDVADMVGVTISTISRWESGDIANMRRDRIVKYASALHLSPSVIMGWEQEKGVFYGIDSNIFGGKPLHRIVSKEEDELLKKYRQLDADGRKSIERQIEFELYRIEKSKNSPEEKEGALG